MEDIILQKSCNMSMIKHFVSMGYRIYRLLYASFFGEFKKKQ